MPIKQSITIQDAIDLLNDALKCDPVAITSLTSHRVLCNLKLADHKLIQVGSNEGTYRVGLLGIINGLFGVDDKGYGPIAAIVDVFDLTVERFTTREEAIADKTLINKKPQD